MKNKTKSSSGVTVAEPVYQRIGGKAALTAAVDGLYVRILGDPALKSIFAGVKLERLKSQQVAFFTQALGGPGDYRGPDMVRAHAHLKINQQNFDRVAGHLVAELKHRGVDRETIEEIVAAVGPLAREIVNTKSNKEQSMEKKAVTSGRAAVLDATSDLTGALAGMKGALDSLGTNVFVADRDLTLVYMNRRGSEIILLGNPMTQFSSGRI